MPASSSNILANFCSSSKPFNVLVFSAKRDNGQRHSRCGINAQKRAKVFAVRRSGACLACRMLKVSCDFPNSQKPGPCKTCLAIASRPHQSGLLAFWECIRTRIRDINIFQHTFGAEFTSLEGPKLFSLMTKTIDSTQAVPSCLDEMVSSILSWMLHGAAPKHSIVGILCSIQFRELSQAFLGEKHSTRFWAILYSSSLAYIYDSRATYDSDLNIDDLRRITYATGSELLLYLDTFLASHRLSKLPQDHVRIFLLVTFGVTIAIAYSTALCDSLSYDVKAPEFHDGNIPKTLWQAMQQHLAQMMAHYLVILASRIGVVLRRDLEREIISSLMIEIIRRGVFVWVARQRAVLWPSHEHDTAVDELFVLKIPQTADLDPTTNALSKTELDSYRSAPVNIMGLQTVRNSISPVNTSTLSIRGWLYQEAAVPASFDSEKIRVNCRGMSCDGSDDEPSYIHSDSGFSSAGSNTGSSSVSHQPVGTRGGEASGCGTTRYFGPVDKRPVI